MPAGSKKKKFSDIKPPDMFLLSYAALATLLLAFFIILNTFTEEKKKEFIKEFQKSMRRREVTFGLGGILPGWDEEETEDFQKMKYIYPDEGSKPIQKGDKGIDLFNREEDQIPAAVVVYFNENDITLSFDGRHFLDNLINLIGERPCALIIEGHTRRNFIPSKGYNNSWRLSLDRAKVVADYLHERGKISMKRLITIGYGNNRPMVKDIKGDVHNDRVSVLINILR